jgi:PAS domain S-box-containing protein
LNRNHKIILWNRSCTELTGFAAAEMIGTENHYIPFYSEKRPVIADLILERDFESLEKFYGTKKVRKSATVPGAYEARDFYANLGGQSRHLYFLAAPIFDEKGEIIAAIETLQDVSKEEQMATELREYAETLQNELRENIHLREEIESLYNYLQSIVDSLPDRLFVLSSDGTIHYMSRNVKEGIGMMAQQFKGKHFLEIVAPELRDLMKAKWEDAKRGIFAPYEVSVRAKDGSKRTFLITPGPFRGSDRYVIVQRDVTELKNLEEKFYESQKMAAVGQLSAGIAHEVRNPLSSIKMSLQILEKRLNPTGNDLKRFKIAQREVEHLENLVNDVLVFAKPAAPKKQPNPIRTVVEEALALADRAIAEKRIEVQVRMADDIPPLNLDAAMLEHAFLNLVLNAADAMEEGGLLKIAVREVPDGEGASSVEVEIEDNGCGIEAEDMRHLFNPFFTRKRTGTGLGLTQVKKIVELHQGAVEITSGKGEGTRVRVRLPRERTEVSSGCDASAPGGERNHAEEEGHGEDSRDR